MTKERLFTVWRTLSFWQRLTLECFFCVVFLLLIELIISGSSGDFGEAVVGGIALGLFYAIVDHAFFARPHNRGER